MQTKPEAGPLSKLTEEEFDYFIAVLGTLVFSTPMAAAHARHKWPLNTIRDYLDIYPDEEPVVRLAKQFWKDLAGQRLNTADLNTKWFHLSEAQAAAAVSRELANLRKGNA